MVQPGRRVLAWALNTVIKQCLRKSQRSHHSRIMKWINNTGTKSTRDSIIMGTHTKSRRPTIGREIILIQCAIIKRISLLGPRLGNCWRGTRFPIPRISRFAFIRRTKEWDHQRGSGKLDVNRRGEMHGNLHRRDRNNKKGKEVVQCLDYLMPFQLRCTDSRNSFGEPPRRWRTAPD